MASFLGCLLPFDHLPGVFKGLEGWKALQIIQLHSRCIVIRSLCRVDLCRPKIRHPITSLDPFPKPCVPKEEVARQS